MSASAREIDWWWVSIGLGNGLVPSGNKPLPEQVLTKNPDALLCHYAKMC